jgi:hypothetical protein
MTPEERAEESRMLAAHELLADTLEDIKKRLGFRVFVDCPNDDSGMVDIHNMRWIRFEPIKELKAYK